MENHFPSEVTHVEHHENKNEVRNVTIVLTVLTLIELALGFWMMKMDAHSTARFATKITIIVLMLAKAYYIVGYFMHLKHEIRNMIMTIVVPLALFIWFIIAFLYDGNSFRNLRNNYDPHFKAQQEVKAKPMEHNKAGHDAEGHKEGGHDESKEMK